VVDIPSTFILANIAKEVLPDVKVIVGGPTAITCSEYLMQNNSIDILVMSEGEETISKLTRLIIDNSNVPELKDILGITYRDVKNKIVSAPPRPLIPNLDNIPFPNRDSMFTLDAYGNVKYMHECSDILTSRGCPYPCTFCCAYEAWGSRKPRFRSVNNIISELKYLITTFNQEFFTFWDDLFTANKARTTELCEKIIQDKLNIKWICITRLNSLDSELLNIMRKAGCIEVQIGIESGSDRVLKYIKKGITLELIHEKVSLIKKSGIAWRIFLIIGFPSETKKEIYDTLNLISEIKPTSVDLSIFCPYPGTDLYYELKEKGALGSDFMKSDMWYPYNNYTGTMSNEEFRGIAFKALEYVDCYHVSSSLEPFENFVLR
jgi:radical SAM superfamily enzyme YgiQ (UPF0313 family)